MALNLLLFSISFFWCLPPVSIVFSCKLIALNSQKLWAHVQLVAFGKMMSEYRNVFINMFKQKMLDRKFRNIKCSEDTVWWKNPACKPPGMSKRNRYLDNGINIGETPNLNWWMPDFWTINSTNYWRKKHCQRWTFGWWWSQPRLPCRLVLTPCRRTRPSRVLRRRKQWLTCENAESVNMKLKMLWWTRAVIFIEDTNASQVEYCTQYFIAQTFPQKSSFAVYEGVCSTLSNYYLLAFLQLKITFCRERIGFT